MYKVLYKIMKKKLMKRNAYDKLIINRLEKKYNVGYQYVVKAIKGDRVGKKALEIKKTYEEATSAKEEVYNNIIENN